MSLRRAHSRWRSHRWQSDFFQNADRRGVYVGCADFLLVRCDVNHVRPVLAGAHDPIDLCGCRIIIRYDLSAFGREPDLSSDKRESVWASQGFDIDIRKRFLSDEVDNGKRMVAATSVESRHKPSSHPKTQSPRGRRYRRERVR